MRLRLRPDVRTFPLGAAMVLSLAFGANRQVQAEETVPAGTEVSSDAVFIPPRIGRPADRAGAGTRSPQGDSDLIALLVPEGGGFTLFDRPYLIWRVTEDTEGAMIASIRNLKDASEGAEKQIAGSFRAGWYALDLRRSDFALVAGKIYEWRVELVPAGDDGTRSVKASYVERLRDADLAHIADTGSAAANGLWFDAIAPLFSVDLSGRVHLLEPERLRALGTSAGLTVHQLSDAPR